MALLVLGVLWCAKLSSSGAVSGSNDRTLARRVPRAVAKGDAGSPFRVDDGGSYCPSPFGQGDLVRSHHTGPRGTDPWHTARAVVGRARSSGDLWGTAAALHVPQASPQVLC